MDISYLKYLSYAVLFVAFFLFAKQFFPSREEKEMRRKTGLSVTREWGEDAVILKWCYPFVVLLLPLINFLPLAGYKRNIERWTVSAGLDGAMSTNEFIGMQMVLALFLPFWLNLVFTGKTTLILAFLVGLLYPVIWLVDKKKNRQKEIIINMPNVVDMLSLSVEAGIDFNTAISRVCEQHREKRKNPLIEELAFLQKNIRLGMTREDALIAMARRVDLQDIYSFTSVLIQADKMGASIAQILKDQSDKLRRERFMKAEQAGAEASQKLLIPMIIFIFPLIFLVILGPYLLKYLFHQ